MTKYYLRTEGVNFDSFVLDTNRSKIIRGGGLMLLNSVEWLEERSEKTDWEERKLSPLRPITAGASWGLFVFEAENDYQAGEVLGAVRRAFDRDARYRYATFALAVLAADDGKDYPKVRARLEAICRWQQMQSPSLAIPTADADQVTGPCEFDTLRPAVDKADLIREEQGRTRARISAACRARWVLDGKERDPKNDDYKGFYEQRTGYRERYTQDLQELAEGEQFGNLNGKMAVIYLDGNHFGRLAQGYCETAEKQEKFDKKLREGYQNGALKSLLGEIRDDPDWKHDDRIRLETLLWGGDEIIWVAPAWKGWWLLGRFFEISRCWNIDGRSLTHGAGLIFCHHDAPLRPIIGLVKVLGDIAKAASEHSANRLAYQVLESFDHAGIDPEAMRKQRWPLGDLGGMIVNGDAMLEADWVARRIKQSDLPKRQLYRLVKTAFDDSQKAMELADGFRKQAGIRDADWKKIETCFGAGLPPWLHLLELWDYLGLHDKGEAS